MEDSCKSSINQNTNKTYESWCFRTAWSKFGPQSHWEAFALSVSVWISTLNRFEQRNNHRAVLISRESKRLRSSVKMVLLNISYNFAIIDLGINHMFRLSIHYYDWILLRVFLLHSEIIQKLQLHLNNSNFRLPKKESTVHCSLQY